MINFIGCTKDNPAPIEYRVRQKKLNNIKQITSTKENDKKRSYKTNNDKHNKTSEIKKVSEITSKENKELRSFSDNLSVNPEIPIKKKQVSPKPLSQESNIDKANIDKEYRKYNNQPQQRQIKIESINSGKDQEIESIDFDDIKDINFDEESKLSKNYPKDQIKNSVVELENNDIPIRKSNFINPVKGKIKDKFNDIVQNTKLTGINLIVESNKVVSASDGKVIYSKHHKEFGNLIIIQYDKARVAYAHLGELLVKQNESVSIGQEIARIKPGTKMYLSVQSNENKIINPLDYFDY